MSTYAKVIKDSISDEGVRVTTFEVRFHRFVLAEFNTHRVLSRNSASSRAIPLAKQIQRIEEGLAFPVAWPAEQKGMQGGAPLSDDDAGASEVAWGCAAGEAIGTAQALGEFGLHKSVANRILEPFMWHTVVVTATAWENFFEQRCSPLAQPEIRVAAEAMREAYDASVPQKLSDDQWHLPYWDSEADGVLYDEWACRTFPHPDSSIHAAWMPSMREAGYNSIADVVIRVSAARCARVSYLTQDGTRDIQQDLDLFERLTTAKPAHWSPLEHVATPWSWNRQEGCIHFGQTPDLAGVVDDFTCIKIDHLPRVGNLLGWRSLRTEVEAQQGAVTFR